MTLNIYIGWDPRDSLAAEVCKYSITRNASIPVNVIFLNQDDLRADGIYTRDADDGVTQYTYTRFLVPHLNNRKGFAVYCDADFLWEGDIAELVELAKPSCAVQVVKHNYNPPAGTKADGRSQTPYPRKNWSSLMIWNCEHKSNEKLTPEHVNQQSAQHLHEFAWLRNDDIGELPVEWNWLVGWHRVHRDGEPKALHYTEGGPWIAKYAACEFADRWAWYRDALMQEQTQVREVYTIGHVTLPAPTKERLLEYLNFSTDPYHRYFDIDTKRIFTPLNIARGRLRNLPPCIGVVTDGEEPLKKGERADVDPILHSFIIGSQGMVADYHDPAVRRSDVPLALRGITKRKVIWDCERSQRDYYYIDSGYFGNVKTKTYHRITRNALQYQGELRPDCPDDRWKRINAQILPHRPGSRILLCPPSAKAMAFWNLDLEDWIKKTVEEIKQHTDREIIIRTKPSRRDRTSGQDSLELALTKDIHCLVTFNSIAAVEALILGKPVFTLGPNAAAPMANRRLDNIDSPWMPSVDEIRLLCVNLAYQQFSNNELRDGTAWRMLTNA